MTIDISSETIKKLEHTIPEIRTRAINNVQSKFQSCRTDLQDLVVDVNDLIKHLMKWFEFKPVIHAKQIFEILLLLIKSKYQAEAVQVLNRYSKRGDLRKIQIFAEDIVSKGYYDEIVQSLNSHKVEFSNTPRHESTVETNGRFEANGPDKTPETCERWKFKDINANSCSTEGLQFEAAWEVAEQKELQAMATLKSSLSTKHSQSEIDHALQYFQQYIHDFPGEFFLQAPFIFTNLLQLIECETNNFDHTPALACCLKLTQSLSRRVIIRRISTMHVFSKAKQMTKQQVTIGSYCYKTFNAVLSLLRNIYVDSNLASVNECILILIEIVELICRTAGVYSAQVEIDYHLDDIIKKLADFQRFIREMTSNYRRNGHKTNRNNSISILYLLCQLLLFKESNGPSEEESMREQTSIVQVQSESASKIDLDISQKIKRLTFKDSPLWDILDSSSSIMLDNNTASESTLGDFVTATENTDQCRMELEIALLDFPLKHFYPSVNELFAFALKIESLPDKSLIKILMNITKSLEPVVMLLRNPKMFNHEQVLCHALKSIDVLTLVNSDQLTQLIFRAITSLTSQFNANDQLRENSERLFLHLLSFGSVDMKRLVYKLTSEKMSHFYESVLHGKKIIAKAYVSSVPESCLFGLPLTLEILSEIICNGLSSQDLKTSSCAENIVILILRMKTLAPSRWNDVCKILTPVLPLLLCHAKTSTAFGQQILKLVEPAPDNDLPTVILIKSNIALLFSRDAQTRSEALYRLLYLIQNVPNAESYMPNMNCIADTLLSDLCVVEPIPYTNNKEFCDLYEVHLIENLLEVLKNANSEPSIRHSSLTQLNIVVEDPVALNHFFEIDGHSVILRALDLALRENSVDNYPYSAIQIIGILMKMSLHIPTFRRRLEDDIQTYVLIVRSLLLFNTDDKFRRECVILLFTLAFSGYIVGARKQLIIPPVCRKLSLPLMCEFSWKSMIEHQNLLDLISNYEKPNNHFDDMNSNYSARSSQLSNDNLNAKIPQIWQYIRIAFNAAWFGSLNQLVDSPNYVQGSRYTEINYKTNPDAMSFNRALHVTTADMEMIEGTSQKYGLHYWVKHLKNATTSAQVSFSCAAIENFSNVDSDGHRTQWDCRLFLQSITRFCTVLPNTQQDEIVFDKICHLLANLVERNFIDVHIWILEKFRQKNCIYMDLISNSNVSTTLFRCNIRFIEAVISKTIKTDSKKVQQLVLSALEDNKNTLPKGSKANNKLSTNLYERIFDIARTRLDSLLNEKKLDEMRVLISLVSVLSSSGKVINDDYTASFISNRLLKLMLIISSLSYVGSNFNKNCLITIGYMMCNVEELRIDRKYIAFLTNFCGHVDFEIRTYSWSILLKVASTLAGAKDLVQEMNSLPGGLYACCLNTVLDDTESAVVRENAALVFATLISYRNTINELNESLYPKSAEGLGCEWIGQLIYHHDLIRKIIESIKYLHVKEMIDIELIESDAKIVPCNLIRSYCIILSYLLPLKGAGDQNEVFITMHEISKVVPRICQSVNKSSLLLLSEICALISQCITHKKSLSDLIVRDFHIIHSLISILNVDMLESISKSIKHVCWRRVLSVLRRLTISTVGYPIICEALNSDQDCFDGVITLFIYGLSNEDFNISVMRFLRDMLMLSQISDYPFVTFTELLNEVKLSANVKESTRKFIFNGNNISQRLVDWIECSESENAICVSELIYGQLANFFERYDECESTKHKLPENTKENRFEYCCKALEELLKCSKPARTLATKDRFLILIVEKMEKISICVGGSFTEFVRRNGNAKVEKFVKRLTLLLNIILCWYSVDCLQDTECIQQLMVILQKFWPSIGVDSELQSIFMQTLLFLTSNSLPVCKAMCTTPQFSVSTTAFLNSIVDFCVAETGKPKTTQANMETLRLALEIVKNCCSCVEARVLITKARMLHTLTRLHPQVTRNQKPWPQLTQFWLSLYEVLTQHNDANKEAHINLLTNIVDSPSRKNRHLALEILRNMSFNQENRAALLSSSDFMRVIYSVLDKKEIGDEQLLITVAIWKLVANNAKGKNIVKNSPISTKLRALREAVDRHKSDHRLRAPSDSNDENAMASGDETIDDLSVALKHVMNILNI